MVKEDEFHQVQRLLNDLDGRSAIVLRLRYGMAGHDPKSLKEIGKRLGLTSERVRQIEQKALSQLREKLETA